MTCQEDHDEILLTCSDKCRACGLYGPCQFTSEPFCDEVAPDEREARRQAHRHVHGVRIGRQDRHHALWAGALLWLQRTTLLPEVRQMSAKPTAPKAKRLDCGEPDCAARKCGHAHCRECGSCVSVESGHRFRDHLSFKEWQITQFCQACQDIVFAEPEDEEDDFDDEDDDAF